MSLTLFLLCYLPEKRISDLPVYTVINQIFDDSNWRNVVLDEDGISWVFFADSALLKYLMTLIEELLF